ncbi:hypothetical protein Hanom_Chr04g00328371 [Helianthus anomalus]
MIPVGEEVMILSSEASMASSGHGLTHPHHVSCACDLCDLSIGPYSGKTQKA